MSTIIRGSGDTTFGGTIQSTGIDDNATSTAITIDASENVGIGTTSPTFPLEVSAGSGDSPFKVSSTDPTVRIWSEDSVGKVYWECQSGDAVIVNDSVETLRIKADGRGLSQFTAKAWVNFNGTGTVAIRDSHNVSSITDNGTGDYWIHFSNNMANTDYAVAGLASNDGEGVSFRNSESSITVSSARVASKAYANTYADGAVLTFIFFGD